MDIIFEAIDEDRPGEKWRRVFDRHWHAYSRWFLREGIRRRPTYLDGLKAVRNTCLKCCRSTKKSARRRAEAILKRDSCRCGARPPMSAAVRRQSSKGHGSALIRNYDYSPKLLEGTWLASRFCGRRVVAMVDCLWGVLDGINEDGLAVSLSFGGRTAVGEGFGIPLALRYVLEFASNVEEAAAILKRLPIHMSYSIALIDRAGHHAIAFVTPDRPVELIKRRVITNHQHKPEWKRHAQTTRSVEREQVLQRAVEEFGDAEAMLSVFLQPPVYQTSYGRGYGTLYTAMYRPQDASVELIWPSARWLQSCSAFQEGTRTVTFSEGTAA